MKRLLRFVGWTVVVVVVLALVAAGGGYLWLRSALPQTSGTVQVQGLAAPVRITRDADDIPHIRAESEADALFGLGYAHAQDRLWQMEFQRRIGFGRLSEILGEDALDTDRFLRTLGTGRAAEQAWQNMSAENRALIEAYVAGINAFVSSHHGRELPIEFTLLGYEPAPWQPADVLVWVKMMAYNLGGNWEDELVRAQLATQFGDAEAAALMPPYSARDPLILPDETSAAIPAPQPAPALGTTASALIAINRSIQENLGLGGKHIGSNNWVVGGARTTTGLPLLANDPHLGAQVPSIWYLAHLSGGALDTIGATVPGLPMVLIGHNQRIGWGVTNTGPDVQDLYIEHIDAQDRVEYQGQMEAMQVINDVIAVKGGADVPIRIRITRHGPLISDALEDSQQALAFRWTALDPVDNTFSAFLGINRAQNWQEFTAAMEPYSAPMQNFVYADVDGNIGYVAPGNVPIRAAGDGTAPVPGWTGEYDWQGYIPKNELPMRFNPPEGYIATANNRVIGDSYPYQLGNSYAAPYRALRINELITSTAQLSPDDIAAMQADVTSAQARELLPYLLETTPSNQQASQALDLLRDWDGSLRGDSAAAAVYAAWYQAIPTRILTDELGADLLGEYGGASSDFFAIILPGLLAQESHWCDDTRTPEAESCQQELALALDDGLARMAEAQSTSDLSRWRWDTAHHAYFPHNPLDNVSALRPVFSRSIPNGGDKFTVDVAPVRASDYDQRHVPSYRHILDFSDLAGSSRFMNTLGQSGSPLSGNYANLIEQWQQVAYLPMRFEQASIDQQAIGTLTLEPSSTP